MLNYKGTGTNMETPSMEHLIGALIEGDRTRAVIAAVQL